MRRPTGFQGVGIAVSGPAMRDLAGDAHGVFFLLDRGDIHDSDGRALGHEVEGTGARLVGLTLSVPEERVGAYSGGRAL